jgi:hypothetical protein
LDLANFDSIKFTSLVADAALDAFFLVDVVQFFLFTGYGFLRAFAEAHLASGAVFFINFIMKERFTDTGRTFFILYVRFILFTEIQKIG